MDNVRCIDCMESYHDYVIKDGQFIGQFDDMYAAFDDPWHQSRQPNPYSRQAAILSMQRLGLRSVVEFGCGLGFYSDQIHRATGIVPTGVDISPVAITKAKQQFPHLSFEVGTVQDMTPYAQHDAVLFAEITWYILPDLPAIIEGLRTHFKGKYLLHNLVFYKGTQKYGTDYFTSLKELIAYIPFPCECHVEATTAQDTTIETHTVFRIE